MPSGTAAFLKRSVHMGVSGRTRVCAVIGDTIEHSMSPAIHNAAFAEKGLDYVYVAFRVEDVASAMAGVRGLGIAGVSVTVPHKLAVIEYLDEVDGQAEAVGSVNTIVNRGGRLCGYTSDGRGAMLALRGGGVEPRGARVCMIGSGGAARAIAFALGGEGAASLRILGIVPDELRALVSDVSAAASLAVEGLDSTESSIEAALAESDLLINCTPVGMHPKVDASVVPARLHRPGLAVFDVVYNPARTRLLREAEAAGAATVSGVEMFVQQAVVQFELWTGQSAPVDVMRGVVVRELGARS